MPSKPANVYSDTAKVEHLLRKVEDAKLPSTYLALDVMFEYLLNEPLTLQTTIEYKSMKSYNTE